MSVEKPRNTRDRLLKKAFLICKQERLAGGTGWAWSMDPKADFNPGISVHVKFYKPFHDPSFDNVLSADLKMVDEWGDSQELVVIHPLAPRHYENEYSADFLSGLAGYAVHPHEICLEAIAEQMQAVHYLYGDYEKRATEMTGNRVS